MTAQISTLTIKDGSGTDRDVQAVDLSGTGAGPWSFLHALVDPTGTPISSTNPLTSQDVGYALHAAAQQTISIPVAGTTTGLDVATLLTAANTADSVRAPLTAVPAWATGARLTVWGATGGITYRTDGVNPTATTGTPLAAGSAGFPIAGAASVAGLRLISQTSAAVTVTIEFLG